jgi:hypothetical protein
VLSRAAGKRKLACLISNGLFGRKESPQPDQNAAESCVGCPAQHVLELWILGKGERGHARWAVRAGWLQIAVVGVNMAEQRHNLSIAEVRNLILTGASHVPAWDPTERCVFVSFFFPFFLFSFFFLLGLVGTWA